MNKSMLLKVIMLITLLTLMFCVYWFTPTRDLLTVEAVRSMTEDIPQNTTTGLVFLFLFFIGGALMIPIPLMAFATSLVFSEFIAVGVAIAGFFLASLSGYMLGRIVDPRIFGEKVDKNLKLVQKRINDKGIWAVMTLRVAPTPPFTVTSFLSGTLQLNPLQYAISSTLGIMPLGLSVLFFGQSAIELLKQPSSVGLLMLAASIASFVIYRMIVTRSREKANS